MASLRTQHTSKIGVTPPPLKMPRGQIFSRKMRQSVPYKHLGERDLMCLLELDPAIRSYRPRPETVPLRVGAEVKKHTFAMRVGTSQGTAMLDIIYRDPNDDLIEAARALCHGRGQHYAAIPITQVASEPRLSNAKLILQHGAVEVSEQSALAIRTAVTVGAATLGQLEDALDWLPGEDLTPRQMALAAVAAGLIAVDFSQPIGADTPVWL